MEVELAENASFWKGIAAGFLAGVGVAAFFRYAPFAKTIEGKIERNLAALQQHSPATSEASSTSRPVLESSSVPDLAPTSRQPIARAYPRYFEMGSAG